jgi:hypothetical protein
MSNENLLDAHKNGGLPEQAREVLELWKQLNGSTHVMGSEEAKTVGVWITVTKPAPDITQP